MTQGAVHAHLGASDTRCWAHRRMHRTSKAVSLRLSGCVQQARTRVSERVPEAQGRQKTTLARP